MVATQEKQKSKLDTKVIVKDCEYYPIDKFLAEFQLCPLQVYFRKSYPDEARIKELSEVLYLDNTVTVLESINWFIIPEDVTEERLSLLGLTGVKPGKYLLNGNTRLLCLTELRKTLEPTVFTDILCQEIDVSQSTYKDLLDIQDYFNSETKPHTRLQKMRAIADLILWLENQNVASNKITKIVQARHNVTATDVKNARKIFLANAYDPLKQETVIDKIQSGYMAFDTAVVLLDLISLENVNLSVEEAIAKLEEKHPSLKADDALLTRSMVYGLRDELIKQAKRNAANAAKSGSDAEGEDDEDEEGDDKGDDKDKTPKAELTEEKKDEKLQDAKDSVNYALDFLKGEVATAEKQETKQETKINYKDSFPLLTKVTGDLAALIPIEEIENVFAAQAKLLVETLEKHKEKMTFEQYTAIAKRLDTLYNKIV